MINIKFEAYKATTKVWEDLTKYLVFSAKNGFQLDEQLDECFLSLFACPYIFQPNTLTRLTITLKTAAKYADSSITTTLQNRKGIDVTTTYNGDKTVTQHITLHYIVANDSVFRQPIFTKDKNGKELYKHDLHLIEPTKLLEGFIGDNLAFTNSLGENRNSDVMSAVLITNESGTYRRASKVIKNVYISGNITFPQPMGNSYQPCLLSFLPFASISLILR